MSNVVRIPTETFSQARMVAGVLGETPGDVIARAWADYWEEHREELAGEFDHVASLLRAGDTAALAEYASRNVDERAARAVEASRSQRA